MSCERQTDWNIEVIVTLTIGMLHEQYSMNVRSILVGDSTIFLVESPSEYSNITFAYIDILVSDSIPYRVCSKRNKFLTVYRRVII